MEILKLEDINGVSGSASEILASWFKYFSRVSYVQMKFLIAHCARLKVQQSPQFNPTSGLMQILHFDWLRS